MRYLTRFPALLLAILILPLFSCGPSLPSESDGKQVIQELVDERSHGRIKLLSFQKTNGQQRENRGVQYYVLEFEMQIEYTERCWTSRGNFVAPIFSTQKIQEDDPTLSGINRAMDRISKRMAVRGHEKVRKGRREKFLGSMTFEKTEKGWRIVSTSGGMSVTVKLSEVLHIGYVEPKLYWQWARYSWSGEDPGPDVIQRANLDGSQIETLVSVSENGTLSGPVLDVVGGKIYWHDFTAWDGDGGTPRIQRANLDGSQIETVVSGSDYYKYRGFSFVLDVAGGKIDWYDPRADTIRRANLDGSRIETVVKSIQAIVYGLVLDVAGGKIYWNDGGVYETPPHIRRANLDGSQIETVVSVSEDDRLSGPVLDVAEGKMYWSDSRADAIQRANLDGSQVETVVSGSDFVLDVAGGKIYYSGVDTIRRANLDGSQVETVVSGSEDDSFSSFVLDVARGKIYWIDSRADAIRQANLDGSRIETVVSGVQASNLVLSYPVPESQG